MGAKGFGSHGYFRGETDRSQFDSFASRRLCASGSPLLLLDSGKAAAVRKGMAGIADSIPGLNLTSRLI